MNNDRFKSASLLLEQCLRNAESDQLAKQAVDEITSHFNFVFVGLYFVNPGKEWAVLRAGSGEAGKVLLAHNHKLMVAGNSIVGKVIGSNAIWVIDSEFPVETREETVSTPELHGKICAEVGVGLHFIRQGPVYFDSPLIPARWHLAFPLRQAQQAIGAMEVYSDQDNDFRADELIYFQYLADYITDKVISV